MKKFFLAFFLCCAGLFANAQDRTVSGVVTSSEDDSPLAGVAVILEGTSHGTMTSEDYKKAKEYAEKAKQKYIEEKKKK